MTARQRALLELVEQAHCDLQVLVDQHFVAMVSDSGLAEDVIADTLEWAKEHNRVIWLQYQQDVIAWLLAG